MRIYTLIYLLKGYMEKNMPNLVPNLVPNFKITFACSQEGNVLVLYIRDNLRKIKQQSRIS